LNYLASQLGGGAIAAVALASKLTEPLERSAFTGIRMLMFSQTVRLVVARDRSRIGALYSLGLRAAFVVLAPLIWWIALNSESLVRLLFRHGNFTPEMAGVVAGVLLALVPSVLFLGVNQLLSNAFYAMDRVKVPAVVMPLGTLVYVAAAVPLSASLGTQGLAAATTLASVTVFAALLGAIGLKVPEIGLARTTGELAFYAILGGTAMLGITAVLSQLGWPPMGVAAASLPLGAASYAAALYLVGDRTFRTLLDLVGEYAAHGVGLTAFRSRNSKAPPAPKSD
jgi:putative peptidoglycan lipid II flippase